jgi:hypothetical protein
MSVRQSSTRFVRSYPSATTCLCCSISRSRIADHGRDDHATRALAGQLQFFDKHVLSQMPDASQPIWYRCATPRAFLPMLWWSYAHHRNFLTGQQPNQRSTPLPPKIRLDTSLSQYNVPHACDAHRLCWSRMRRRGVIEGSGPVGLPTFRKVGCGPSVTASQCRVGVGLETLPP